MGDHTLDPFTRQTADGAARRRSLLALGGAALAAGWIGQPASAAKKGGKREEKRCKKQVGKCREGLAELCEVVFGEEDVPECLELFAPCCDFLEGCNAAQALSCAAEVAGTIPT